MIGRKHLDLILQLLSPSETPGPHVKTPSSDPQHLTIQNLEPSRVSRGGDSPTVRPGRRQFNKLHVRPNILRVSLSA